jgi:hypothetical protein
MTSMNSIARIYALILGGVLLVIGVLGWIPALTPGGLFLGLFALSPVHNLVHLLTGLVGLSAGLLLPDRSVRLYTLTMTILYGVVALVGYVQASALEVLALNVPDTLLHTANFVLSLLVALAALSEQGFLDRQAELALSLLPQDQQGRAGSLGFAAMTLRPPSQAGRQQAPGMPDATAVLQEQVRRLEHEASKIGPQAEHQQAIEQEVRRLRRDVEALRASLQALAQGWQPSRPPETPWSNSWPSLGGEPDAGARPHE